MVLSSPLLLVYLPPEVGLQQWTLGGVLCLNLALRPTCCFSVCLTPKLQQELQVQQNEISREVRLKEKLDKEVKQLHIDIESKMGEIRALNLQGQRAKEEQQRLEQQLKELKVNGGVGLVLFMVCCVFVCSL